jgi:Holliday junction resolvase RusA-like endonuclease
MDGDGGVTVNLAKSPANRGIESPAPAWREVFNVRVYGIPVGQPRARATVRRFGATVRAGVYDPGTANDWKGDVQRAFRDILPNNHSPLTGPILVDVVAWFPRPMSHHVGSRAMCALKANAPIYHTGKPDRDNIDKALLDAMTDLGVLADDKNVCAGGTTKLYVNAVSEYRPGAQIRVCAWEVPQ